MIAIQHALIMSRMPMFSIEGLEGDEVISLLVDALCRSGVYQRVTVWSSDRDFHQLLTEGPPVVDQFDPIRKDWITADSVEATYGVPPKQFPVLRAFTGDVSDGIPPIRKGIGLKKAAVWVTERKFPITEWEWVLLRRNLQLIRLPTLNDLDRADIPTTFRERVLNVKDPLAPPTFATVGMRELDVGHQLKIMYRISAGLLQPLITYARTRG
jgi:5'-3' exonuclease